jgi:hypothetical protein
MFQDQLELLQTHLMHGLASIFTVNPDAFTWFESSRFRLETAIDCKWSNQSGLLWLRSIGAENCCRYPSQQHCWRLVNK